MAKNNPGFWDSFWCIVIVLAFLSVFLFVPLYLLEQADEDTKSVSSFCIEQGLDDNTPNLNADGSIECQYRDEDGYIAIKTFTPREVRCWLEEHNIKLNQEEPIGGIC